jgi:hypothetical protein
MEKPVVIPEPGIETPALRMRGHLRLVVDNEHAQGSRAERVDAMLQESPTTENVQYVLHAIAQAI